MTDRRVAEVIAFEAVPLTAPGSRRVVVRWDDGSTGEALRWYDDEILFSEGDVLGKTAAELRALFHRRDVDYLRRPDPDDEGLV